MGVDDRGVFDPLVSCRGASASFVLPPIGVDALAEKLRCVTRTIAWQPVVDTGACAEADPRETDVKVNVASSHRVMAPPIRRHDTRIVRDRHKRNAELAQSILISV